MKKKKLLLTAIAVLLVLTLGISGTWAYFTTYAKAEGGNPVQLGYETTLTENVEGTKKEVTVSLNDNSEPVYVRVKAYIGAQYEKNMEVALGNGWKKDGDYFVYGLILDSENPKTSVLTINLVGLKPDEVDVDSVNIVVMEEAVPVCYAADKYGNIVPQPADWGMAYNKEGGGK